jgi:dipeptidyl aminopeptidase/acylaminoacyl peptidase
VGVSLFALIAFALISDTIAATAYELTVARCPRVLGVKADLPLAPDVQDFSSDSAARSMVEAAQFLEVALSPNGDWIAYTVTNGSFERNNYTSELLLQHVNTGSYEPPLRVVEHVSERPETFTPRWRPLENQSLSYFQPDPTPEGRRLVSYDISTKQTTAIVINEIRKTPQPNDGPVRPLLKTVSGNYRWSPRGRFIAFTAPLREGNGLDPRRGVVVSGQWTGSSTAGLFVLDVMTGAVEQLSPETLHVVNFDWSPDERALAVSATPDAEGIPAFRTDLFIIDRSTRSVSPLVVQAGMDGNPRWSPDGRWIVFTSQFGFQTYYGGWSAVVEAKGGKPIRLGNEEDPKLPFYTEIYWAPDSRAVYFSSEYYYHMTRVLLRACLPEANSVTSLGPSPLGLNEEPFDDNFSLSADARMVAFTRETMSSPPELYVTSPTEEGFSRPRQVTHLTPSFPLDQKVRLESLSWPSRDGKFTIHGILLTPAASWKSGRVTAALPTLVYLHGGPNMFPRGFNQQNFGSGSQMPLAARGYAVLVPNTRGRGGYGEAFQRGMRDGPSAGRLPYEDMMAGVDLLVQRGIADSERLGVYGFSYGGYLTSYVVTQTNRFKAAVVRESHMFEWLTFAMRSLAGTDSELLMRDLYGFRDPFDNAERTRLIAESPGFNMNRVSTPTLLLFGNKAGARSVGRPLFGALQWRKIPSEFVVYDDGHSFERPAAIADCLARTADWFDYWIRGYEDPAPGKREQYAKWRKMHEDWKAAKAARKAVKK